MATQKNKADQANEKDQPAAKDQSQESTTTTASDESVADTHEVSSDKDTDATTQGEATGAVVYGDPGIENLDALEPDGDSGLGTTRVGTKEVPWTYLTPEHFEDVDEVRTSDSDDEGKSWTSQHLSENDEPVALVPVQKEPGQTFTAEQLPNVDAMRAAGIDPVQWVSGLPVRGLLSDEEEADQRSGAFG